MGTVCQAGRRVGRRQGRTQPVRRSQGRGVSLGTCRGTHKATGSSFLVRFAHAFTAKDNKIVRFPMHTVDEIG
jgi:hypothetical protein